MIYGIILKVRYYKGLVHVIMEPEKSQHLHSASWRPRKASGIVPVQTQRPGNQRSQQCKSQPESEGLRSRSSDI